MTAGDFHKMRVEVQVELDDGTTHTVICKAPRGSWGVKMAPGEHEAKLQDCLKYVMPEKNGTALIEQLDRLDTLDAHGVQSLLALMTTAVPGRT